MMMKANREHRPQRTRGKLTEHEVALLAEMLKTAHFRTVARRFEAATARTQ